MSDNKAIPIYDNSTIPIYHNSKIPIYDNNTIPISDSKTIKHSNKNAIQTLQNHEIISTAHYHTQLKFITLSNNIYNSEVVYLKLWNYIKILNQQK